MTPRKERRAHPLKRVFYDAFWRRGRFEVVKLAHAIGLGIVAWWMVAYADKLTGDWFSAMLLASILVFPSLAHKLISKRLEK